MNKIEEGIAANDTAITDVKNNYMPVSGGLFTGNMGIAGNLEILGNDTLALSTDGSITFPSAGGKLNGISDLKGTSSTIAASQKCLSDNYVAKTSAAVSAAINLLPAGTSAPVDGDYYVCQSVGGGTTDTTYYRRPMSYLWSYINGKMGNSYLPISGGTITNDTTIMGSTGQYGIKFTNGDIQFLSDGGATVEGTITGISNSKGTSTTRAMSEKGVADNYIAKTDISNTKGTSSTIVPSQKCLNDNYVAKSDLPSNLLKYQVINSTSDIGTDANTAYLILE
jgi:hypothetical protein